MFTRRRFEDCTRPPPVAETRKRGNQSLKLRQQIGGGFVAQPRALALPRDAARVTWSLDAQAQAVDRGMFLERDYSDNHVRVIPLKRYASDQSNPVSVTDADVMAELERDRFRGDAFATHALAFIEQQDRHGWSGAWNASVERWSPQLRWYKAYKAKDRELSQHMRAIARKRWAK